MVFARRLSWLRVREPAGEFVPLPFRVPNGFGETGGLFRLECCRSGRGGSSVCPCAFRVGVVLVFVVLLFLRCRSVFGRVGGV